jgi:outer membrane protein OmpA-like peptidoglycan-associated protein
MRRVLTTALGIGLAWGCAADEHARREESKSSSKESKAKEKGTGYVIVQTRTRNDAAAQAEQQRVQAEQQRMREAEARVREAADREAEARAKAELEAERAQRLKAERASEADRAELAQLRAQQAQRELEQARQAQAQLSKDLEEERQRARAQAQALADAQRARVEAERARVQAEQNARGALEQVATVRQEARGLVVTLAAPVLFGSNDATLLPSAQERLDVVADALRASGNESFRVEGHTDSRGSDNYNIELSRRRAEAVRTFLMSRGVDPDQIRAYGYGEQRPVASNASPEGRANNRRVEIVLPNFGVGGAGGPNEGPRPSS